MQNHVSKLLWLLFYYALTFHPLSCLALPCTADEVSQQILHMCLCVLSRQTFPFIKLSQQLALPPRGECEKVKPRRQDTKHRGVLREGGREYKGREWNLCNGLPLIAAEPQHEGHIRGRNRCKTNAWQSQDRDNVRCALRETARGVYFSWLVILNLESPSLLNQ